MKIVSKAIIGCGAALSPLAWMGTYETCRSFTKGGMMSSDSPPWGVWASIFMATALAMAVALVSVGIAYFVEAYWPDRDAWKKGGGAA